MFAIGPHRKAAFAEPLILFHREHDFVKLRSAHRRAPFVVLLVRRDLADRAAEEIFVTAPVSGALEIFQVLERCFRASSRKTEPGVICSIASLLWDKE